MSIRAMQVYRPYHSQTFDGVPPQEEGYPTLQRGVFPPTDIMRITHRLRFIVLPVL